MGRAPKWTKTLILQAFQDFYNENERLPTVKEIDKNSLLPYRRTITTVMDMTVSELFETYFFNCYKDSYNGKTKEYWTEDFIKQYELLDYPTETIYNKYKSKDSPNSQSIRKWNGNLSWGELLKKFDLLDGKEKRIPLKISFVFTNEKTPDILKSEIEEIIKNK